MRRVRSSVVVGPRDLEQAHFFRGEFERAVELASGNLAALPAAWVHEYLGLPAPASTYDRIWLVVSLSQLGRFAEAAGYEAEAIRLAEQTQRAFGVGMAYLAAGTRHLIQGDWAKAHSMTERGIEVARTGNLHIQLPRAVASSAWALAQLGEASEALARLRFFLAGALLTSYHRAVCEPGRTNQNSLSRGGLVMNKRTSEDVARRAYELFLSRDGQHGRDVDDWLEAERQLTSNGTPPRPAHRSPSHARAAKTPARQRVR